MWLRLHYMIASSIARYIRLIVSVKRGAHLLRQSCVERCLPNVTLSVLNLSVARWLYVHLAIADVTTGQYPVLDLTCWVCLDWWEQLRANCDLMVRHVQVSVASMGLLLIETTILILHLLLSSV